MSLLQPILSCSDHIPSIDRLCILKLLLLNRYSLTTSVCSLVSKISINSKASMVHEQVVYFVVWCNHQNMQVFTHVMNIISFIINYIANL